jgi:hypothetical protein
MKPFTFATRKHHQDAFKRWFVISTFIFTIVSISLTAITLYHWSLLCSYKLQQQHLQIARAQLSLYQEEYRHQETGGRKKNNFSLATLLDLIGTLIPDKVRLHCCTYHDTTSLLLSGYALKQPDIVNFVRNLTNYYPTHLCILEYDINQKGFLFTLSVSLVSKSE